MFGFRTAVIYYGYTAALAAAAASAKKEEKSPAELKLAALLKGKPDRPDMWAHTRSHPSAFLTTRHTAPRIFPFPLGKTAEGAAIKEELWWEGGNPPHVVSLHDRWWWTRCLELLEAEEGSPLG